MFTKMVSSRYVQALVCRGLPVAMAMAATTGFAALVRPADNVRVREKFVKTEFGQINFFVSEALQPGFDLDQTAKNVRYLLSDFSEKFFQVDLLEKHAITISVAAAADDQVDGTWVHNHGNDFLLKLVMGTKIPPGRIQAFLETVIAHEIGHIIFETFAGFADQLSLPARPQDGGQTSSARVAWQRAQNFRRTFETYNELFADTVSYYLNNLDDSALIEAKGEWHGFRKPIVFDGAMLDSNYWFLAPSRQSIYQLAVQNSSGTGARVEDLFLLFRAFTEEIQKFSQVKAFDKKSFEKMNLSLQRLLKDQNVRGDHPVKRRATVKGKEQTCQDLANKMRRH